MKSKYVKPCISCSVREVENAVPAALIAGFAASLITGLAAGAAARKVWGDKILFPHSKPNLSE